MKTTLSMKGIGILVFALMVLSVPASFAADYDAESVLQAYRDSYNWLNSATMKVQSASESLDRPVLTKDEAKRLRLEENSKYYWEQTREETEATFHSNGRDRWQYIGDHSTIDLHTGKVLINQYGKDMYHIEQLVSPELGFYAFQWCGPLSEWGSVEFRELDDFSYNSRSREHRELLPAVGYFEEFRDQRIPDMLTTENMTLRDEVANGKHYCIVEATVPNGAVTLWLDPDLNFALHRSIALWEFAREQSLADESLPPLPPRPYQAGYVTETTILKHEMMDGYSIPLEAEVLTYSKYGDTTRYRTKRKIVLSDVQLNPDFAALHAFVLTVAEGTRVGFTYPSIPDDNRVYRIGSTWEKGKVVFKSEEDAALGARLDKAMAGATIKTGIMPSKLRMKLVKLRYKIAQKSFLGWYYFKNALAFDWGTVLLSLTAIVGCFYVAGRIIYRKGAASRDQGTQAEV